ncbi:MAG: RNA polymerase sigma factor [archaeon]
MIAMKEDELGDELEKITVDDSNSDDSVKTTDELIYESFEENLEDEDFDFDEDFEDYEDYDVDVDLSDLPIPLEQAAKDYQDAIEGEIRNNSFNYIYNHYKPKLERLGYRKNDDELAQELTIVLERAANTFDSNGGAKFNTYFWKCARNHMGTLNIRRNAKKRTAEHGTVSMQQKVSLTYNTETEIGDFIEDDSITETYDKSIFYYTLENEVFPYLKENEVVAIKMHLQGHTLEEIGQALGGITAPAVHVKLRRLAQKKVVGRQLRDLYKYYIQEIS